MKTNLSPFLVTACGILLISPSSNALPIEVEEEGAGFDNTTALPECLVDDVVYKGGDVVPSPGPCEECHCEPPSVTCSMIKCKPNISGCRVIQMPNHCCPQYKCDCEFKGKMYNNGERLERPDDPCHVCYCKGGEIMCTSITCYERDDCTPRYISGQCCPKYDHCPVEPSHISGNTVRSVNTSAYSNREMQPWLLTKAVKSQTTTPPSQENSPVPNNYPYTIRIREVIPTTETAQRGNEVRLEIPVRPHEVHSVVAEPQTPPPLTSQQPTDASSEEVFSSQITPVFTEDASMSSEGDWSGSSGTTNSKYIVQVKPLSPLAESKRNMTKSVDKLEEKSVEKKNSVEEISNETSSIDVSSMENNATDDSSFETNTTETTMPSSEHVLFHHPVEYLFESESNEEIGTESYMTTTEEYSGTSIEFMRGGVYEVNSSENETLTDNEVMSTSSPFLVTTELQQTHESSNDDLNVSNGFVTEKQWSIESIEVSSSEENSSENASVGQDIKEFIPFGLDLGDQIQYLKLGGHHPVQNSFEESKTSGNEKDSYYTKEPEYTRYGSSTPENLTSNEQSNENVETGSATPDISTTTSKEQWASEAIDKIVSNIMLPMQGIDLLDANSTSTVSTQDANSDEFLTGDKSSFTKNELSSFSTDTSIPQRSEIGTSFPADIGTVTDFLEISPTVGSFLPMKEEIESTISQQDNSEDPEQNINIEDASSPRQVTAPSLESLLQQLPSTLDDRDLFVLREFLKKHMNIS